MSPKILKQGRRILLAVVLLCFAYLFVVQKLEIDAQIDPSLHDKKVAVIYAAPSFHDEVSCSVVCILHELGYHTVVYIRNGFQVAGVQIPFTGRRQKDSQLFYGRCVSEFITISDPLRIIESPAITVFVTYPMYESNFRPDRYAYQILKHMSDNKVVTPVVLVAHHSQTYLDNAAKIAEFIPLNQTTFMFLGEHTYKDALNVTERKVADDDMKTAHQLSYFYPTVPMQYIVGPDKASSLLRLRGNAPTPSRPTFVVQGNFGGKHAHRKDVHGVVSCVDKLESDYAIKSEFPPLSVDFIGHVTGKVKLAELQFNKATLHGSLNPVSYYQAIAGGRFLVTAIRDETYKTEKATSSVPAALITEIPLVATSSFLNVYSCLRDSPMHQSISKTTECESMEAAVALNDGEYKTLQEEMRKCNGVLWQQAKKAFVDVMGDKV